MSLLIIDKKYQKSFRLFNFLLLIHFLLLSRTFVLANDLFPVRAPLRMLCLCLLCLPLSSLSLCVCLSLARVCVSYVHTQPRQSFKRTQHTPTCTHPSTTQPLNHITWIHKQVSTQNIHHTHHNTLNNGTHTTTQVKHAHNHTHAQQQS